MSGIVTPGAGILYMKVGTHARETLDDIIKRKTREIEKEGVAFWGMAAILATRRIWSSRLQRITANEDKLFIYVCTR
jgi:hypothetical protein